MRKDTDKKFNKLQKRQKKLREKFIKDKDPQFKATLKSKKYMQGRILIAVIALVVLIIVLFLNFYQS